MTTKNIVLFLWLLVVSCLLFVRPAAAETCTTQYGGVTTCVPTDLTINKQVKNPVTNLFVENLSTTDPAFSPSGEVHFKLTIKNGSNLNFSSVTVKDVLPAYLSFEAGPGTYNASTKTLTFALENLLAGESRSVELLGKVDPATSFPTSKQFVCVVNEGKVTVDTLSDKDTAQLCIQTQVLGVTTLPAAGFDDLVVLLPFIGTGLGGLALIRKKSN